jgi:tetratricopeptide (TPR) repeat protein
MIPITTISSMRVNASRRATTRISETRAGECKAGRAGSVFARGLWEHFIALCSRGNENFQGGGSRLALNSRRTGTVLAFEAPAVLEHASLSPEERSQIVQTIEMFEVITQTQPDDYQSLEILKDGYTKIGNADEALRISRKLAEAYFNVGSYTLAMQECETILQREPNAPEVLAMLGDIESRLQAAGESIVSSPSGPATGLMAAPHLNGNGQNGSGSAAADGALVQVYGKSFADLQERGDGELAKFLVMQQLFPEAEVASAVETATTLNADLSGQALAASLLDKICRQDSDKLDAALSQLIDRTKFPYVPLEYYDVDRQIARMLPDHLTLGRLFLPFDLISRTIMVACCNPFDATGREAVEQSLDFTVTWYLARPTAIIKALQDVYRLEGRV